MGKIKGYRELNEHEIAIVNNLKDIEHQLGSILQRIIEANIKLGDKEANRWVSLARTHLETGFMFAVKSVVRPTNGLGRVNPIHEASSGN